MTTWIVIAALTAAISGLPLFIWLVVGDNSMSMERNTVWGGCLLVGGLIAYVVRPDFAAGVSLAGWVPGIYLGIFLGMVVALAASEAVFALMDRWAHWHER